jgi:hypothetical protein
MYGYTAEEAIGQPIDLVIPDHPERRQEELDIRARLARGERTEHYQTERRRKDGTRFPVSVSISPVRDTSGRIVAAAGFALGMNQWLEAPSSGLTRTRATSPGKPSRPVATAPSKMGNGSSSRSHKATAAGKPTEFV